MFKIATAQEMQHIDRITIGKYGIPGTILMERAGLAVARRIHELFFESTGKAAADPEFSHLRKVIVLCGGGNNGGDGFVVARILHNQGRDVEVFLSVPPGHVKGDARIHYRAAKKFGVKVSPLQSFVAQTRPPAPHRCLIVDALLGTGLSKAVREPLSGAIGTINRMECPVLSIDIPSGICSDTGQVMGVAVQADATVTFGLAKRGHLLHPGAEKSGKIYIEEIGFPRELLGSEKVPVHLPQKSDIVSLLPPRPVYSHKGTYGHVLIVAGSKGKTGAAFMSARSCLRAGAGLVTIGVPQSLENIFQSRVTEEMILSLPDKGNGTLAYHAVDTILSFLGNEADALAIGPGLSCDHEIERLIHRLIPASPVPLVIDADGINALSANRGVLKKRRSPVILTPHPGEMARLIGQRERGRPYPSEREVRMQIERDRIAAAIDFSKKMKSFLVLKGVPTVTATPEGRVFINPTGNPGMATAGTGDVLTGMIAGFLAQRVSPQNAAVLGAYLHGLIGDMSAEKKGKHSIVASDIINAIPRVFRSLKDRAEKFSKETQGDLCSEI